MTGRKTASARNRRDRLKHSGGVAARAEALAEKQAVDVLLHELDEARRSAGMTKAALAERANVPQASVRKLFASRTANPALKTLYRLARPLGLRVALTGIPAGGDPHRSEEG